MKKLVNLTFLLIISISFACEPNGNYSSGNDDIFWSQMQDINNSIRQGEQMMGIPQSVQNLRYRCTELQDRQACNDLQNWFNQNERYLQDAINKANRDAEQYRRMYNN